ncbi:MAG: TPM domain-containing protein [Burkholderiales bacterium]|nr:TPM domain-containing protein [Burkholderiales bacterium]
MIKRFLTHLFTTKRDGRQAFPPPTLEAIQQAIAHGEVRHRAEIRLIIEPALPLVDVIIGKSARQRAGELFATYGIWDTEENIGVLVYINLADHKVEIVTDRAIGRTIASADWQAICQTMTAGFRRGDYQASAIAAVETMNDLLHTPFPAKGENANELPNRPLIV